MAPAWLMSLKNTKSKENFLKSLEPENFGPVGIDNFLGGKVRLAQTKDGYRAGQDAVLLAAAIPAKKGEHVLDLGAGTGVVGLCLARRCDGVTVTGVEIQEHFYRLGQKNIELNGLEGRVSLINGSINDNLVGLIGQSFDHVFANPPYLDSLGALPPARDDKKIAYVRVDTTLADWVDTALVYAKPKGTVSFIYPADHADELIRHMYGHLGELVIFPLWPRAGVEAKRVIIQGRKGLAGGTTIAPGMCLHGTNERYSKEAEAVLREGQPILLSKYQLVRKS